MRNIVSLVLLLLFIGTVASVSNAIEINGKVTDTDGNGLPSVSIVTNIDGIGGTSELGGSFEFKFDDEVRRVTFSAVGYKSRQFKITDIPQTVILQPMFIKGEGIMVTADRVRSDISTIAYENISADEIKRDFTVSEFPHLLASTPNVISYSESGASLGDGYFSIRGFDDKRVTTYVNGVPLNDPEDHTTYFIDLPDFVSNVDDIQVQRGVGNSLYGDASFGGTINVVSTVFARQRGSQLTMGYGEYTSDGKSVGDIYKQSLQFASGLVDGRWAYAGRFTKQKTSGYRENSWYNGWSYYFALGRIDPKMTTELRVYGGPIKNHLAYYGVGRETLATDWRNNDGITGYDEMDYPDAIQEFNQPHYQLTNIYTPNDQTTLTNTLFYISGKGYYQQDKPFQDYLEYGFDSTIIGTGDSSGTLVRQKWVAKNQVGWNTRADFKHDRGSHTLGGSFYYFESDHWGRVMSAEGVTDAFESGQIYYRYEGKKYVGSLLAQEQYQLSDKLSTQLTAQLRWQKYKLDQEKMGMYQGYSYDLDYLFFSPRLGLNYKLNEQARLFVNFAVASRTPTDHAIFNADDADQRPSLEIIDSTANGSGYDYQFGDATATAERVYDFEFGGSYQGSNWSGSANLFWMDFKDEIFSYGLYEIPTSFNFEGSYHSGIEMSVSYAPANALTLSGNFSLNRNRIKSFDSTFYYSYEQTPGNFVDTSKSFNFKDKVLPGFPDYIGNFVVDYHKSALRLTYTGRLIGKQYADIGNIEKMAIESYIVSSLSASYTFKNVLSIGNLTILGRVDNLFDKRFESKVSWAENWAESDGSSNAMLNGWAAYFVGPERSFWGQIKLDLF